MPAPRTHPSPAADRPAPGPAALLAADVRRVAVDPARVVAVDGVVAARGPGGLVRRAEPGSVGPLVLEAARTPAGVRLEVWGPAGTPADEADQALAHCAAWAGLADDLEGFVEVADRHPVTSRLRAHLGPVRLSRLPRLGEALGRAVLAQLVQSEEARRSCAQLARLAGTPAPAGLRCWPTAAQVGAVPAWSLRRCGASMKMAQALHAGAVEDRRLAAALDGAVATAAADAVTGATGEAAPGAGSGWTAAAPASGPGWAALDRRLRSLPSIGVWTSAETRLALGDPDAVSVGDYHLPSIVGTVLGDGPTDDAGMLQVLAPFAPHRGRVVRLVLAGMFRGLVAGPQRKGPHKALSAHRYW